MISFLLAFIGAAAVDVAQGTADTMSSISGITIGQLVESLTAIGVSLCFKLVKVFLIW